MLIYEIHVFETLLLPMQHRQFIYMLKWVYSTYVQPVLCACCNCLVIVIQTKDGFIFNLGRVDTVLIFPFAG